MCLSEKCNKYEIVVIVNLIFLTVLYFSDLETLNADLVIFYGHTYLQVTFFTCS